MPPLSYSGYRFPRDIIQRAVWMYLRFTLSFRDVEELLAERGIAVTYESIRRWVAVLHGQVGRPVGSEELGGVGERPSSDFGFAPCLSS